MKTHFLVLTLFLLTGLSAVSSAESATETNAVKAVAEVRKPSPIAQLLESDFRPRTLRAIDKRRSVWEGVAEIYAAHGMQPIWTGSATAKHRAQALIKTLLDSTQHGLLPGEYGTDHFVDTFHKRNFSRLTPDTARDATSLDVSLTAAMLAYAHDMWHGRVEPTDVRSEPTLYREKDPIDAAELWRSIESNGVALTLAALQPQHEHYTALTERMRAVLAREARGGYTQVTTDTLKRGDRGEQVFALMKRLREGKYLYGRLPSNPAAARYDRQVEAAVQLLQRASGLQQDGVFGPATAAILNQTADERMQRLAINMDRWRWLPPDLGADYVWVNIPDYSLRVYADGQQKIEKKINLRGADGQRLDPQAMDWTTEKIMSAIRTNNSEQPYLDESAPLYVTYFTAMPTARGDLRLLADVDQRDPEMLKALTHAAPQVAGTQTTASLAR